MSGLIPVEEAHARVMRLVAPLPTEWVPLAEAGGRVLAEDVVAGRDQPPFRTAAMDGYAVRATDAVQGARLAVVGTAMAGTGFYAPVPPGGCVRIFTGAPVPDDADRVIIQEDVVREGDGIRLGPVDEGGDNVRPAGGDFARGARMAAPRRLGPADLALLAAMNVGSVPVAHQPVVALIPTGDELVIPGEEPGRDQIVASNVYGLKALVDAAGGRARLLPIARDTPESLAAVLDLARGADLIVTIGGASVGDYDLVASTARERGLALEFHKVAMRPGKPLMAGLFNGVPMLGLPGTPVSALVCGHLFLRPAIERMLGLAGDPPARVPARLGVALGPNGERAHFMRAMVVPAPDGRWRCTPFRKQDSSLLSVLADANALLIRPPYDPARAEGDAVEFTWL
jgi:molybdopterin molybdotransferase